MPPTSTAYAVTFSRANFKRGLDEITQDKKRQETLLNRYDRLVSADGAVPTQVARQLLRSTANQFKDSDAKYGRALTAAGLSSADDTPTVNQPTPPPRNNRTAGQRLDDTIGWGRQRYDNWRGRRNNQPTAPTETQTETRTRASTASVIAWGVGGMFVGILLAILLLIVLELWHNAVNAFELWIVYPIGVILIMVGFPILCAYWFARRAERRSSTTTTESTTTTS